MAAGLSGSLWASGCRGPQVGKGPSIILITVDTLRPDHLGCYGYSRNTSPNIDEFAADALLFENCLSHAPETWNSFGSILSGFLPHETKTLNGNTIHPEIDMLAEMLQRAGYKTMAVVSNYVLRKDGNYQQGFMIYDDTMDDHELVRKGPERIAEHTTNRAIELLDQFHKDKLFIWVHYQDPHGPYTPPRRFGELFRDADQKPQILKLNLTERGQGGIPSYQRLGENRDFHHYVSQYDGEIRYQDEDSKRLFDALKKYGLYDDALIILTSDHGEGMGEHNYYFAHGDNLYNNLTHVPLIVKYGKELTGRRTDFVQHLDIVPTVLKVAGMKPDSRLRGRDLRKLHETPVPICAEMPSRFVKGQFDSSIVLDGYKLIYMSMRYDFEHYELFDLNTDAYEEHNLIKDAKHRELVKNLKGKLRRIRKHDSLKLRIAREPRKLTDEEKEKLKSLGYVQ